MWKEEGVQFLSYINPYVAVMKTSPPRRRKHGPYLAKDATGGDYPVEFGEFHGGVVDLTNPEAYDWFKASVKKNMIALAPQRLDGGFRRISADRHVSAQRRRRRDHHAAWPALWAKCNYEALQETGKRGEILFFMRAGYTGSQKCSTMMRAGDQNVDRSLDDGLASVVPAALSLAHDRPWSASQRYRRLHHPV